ncbi:PPOX class F420-dependent oxidoreductase [Streptomonospora sp. S1-112]|uniref:PPOX class F420-dependent oxidoreductase n=1 Tax=Streptomonospora mangrovi TaxID=2883123 RepID=A0A9X3SGN9_9ACTN|nr:PPOX class F420-dependent oxidoreductase [Streptomonospora mangrovi]MDA0568018.1 PPOX class F420-dependent oxidoreductase [Streptomonospora mangrovi]
MCFTESEIDYLATQPVGRLATVGPRGARVRPVAFRLNEDGTIDIGGPDITADVQYRDVCERPDREVAFVVDDTASAAGAARARRERGVEVRGRAEPLTLDEPPISPAVFAREVIRIHPRAVASWNVDPDRPGTRATG